MYCILFIFKKLNLFVVLFCFLCHKFKPRDKLITSLHSFVTTLLGENIGEIESLLLNYENNILTMS